MRRNQPEFRWIEVKDLSHDDQYNFAWSDPWLKKLGATMELDKMPALEVVETSDGRLIIVDGKHRRRVVHEKYGPTTKVLCRMRYLDSLADEAHLFELLQRRRTMGPYEGFNAALKARHEEAVNISKVLANHNLRMTQTGGDHGVTAVRSVERVFRLGPDVLAGTLALLSDSWGYDKQTWNGYLIEGTGFVLDRHPDIERRALAVKLAKFKGGAAGMVGAAAQRKELRHVSVANAVAGTEVDLYNVGRRSRKLPSWD